MSAAPQAHLACSPPTKANNKFVPPPWSFELGQVPVDYVRAYVQPLVDAAIAAGWPADGADSAMCVGFPHRRALSDAVKAGRATYAASLHLVCNTIALQAPCDLNLLPIAPERSESCCGWHSVVFCRRGGSRRRRRSSSAT